MGGYAPPPDEDAGRPKTRAEADAQNVIGRENRQRIGLSGYGGTSEYELQYYDEQRRQEAEQRAFEQQQQQSQRREQQQQQNEQKQFGDAYRMAIEAQRRGDTLNPYVLEKARRQGFAGNVTTTSFESSRQTVPLRENASLPGTLTDSQIAARTVTAFVPYGNRAQTEIENAKVIAAPSGEVGIYQRNRHGQWMLTSSGSAAALQSGRFTINNPETPIVFTQESGGRKLSGRANPELVSKVLANPDKFSRLGAEAYGGFVIPLDNRTIESTGAKLSTYGNKNNLAGLVNPQAVNIPKAQRDKTTIPWDSGVSDSDPAVRVIGGKDGKDPANQQNPPGSGSGLVTGTMGKPFGGAAPGDRGPGDAGGLPKPFRSEITGVRETTSRQSGALPFFGVVPYLSPFLATFMPQQIRREVDTLLPERDELTVAGKMAGRDDFSYKIGTSLAGLEKANWLPSKGEIPVGEPVYGETVPVGSPKVTTTERYNPLTGQTEIETTTEQEYSQSVTQEYLAYDISKQNVGGKQTITTVTEGKTPFTEMVQSIMPERKASTEKTFYLLDNPKVGAALFTLSPSPNNLWLVAPGAAKKAEGPAKFVSSVLPTTTEWSKQSYENVREDPLFAAPMVAVSVALPASGSVLRSAGVGTRVLTATSRSGQAYQFASRVGSAALIGLFADYSAKQVTGSSLLDITQSEYAYTVSGGKTEHPATMMQRKFIGWDAASKNANRLSLEIGAGLVAYSATDYVGIRASQIVKTRGNTNLNSREFALPSREGFPINARITTRDLTTSFERGRMATANPAKLTQTEWSISGRRLAPEEYPTNPQVRATAGRTDVFSGADTPYLDQGYVGAGHSEIPGMYTAPSAITYFTKPGTGGSGFGITNDLLGIYRNPTMYVTGIEAGKERVIPESVLNTPARGYGANDPMNPRNLAVRNWMEANMGYDEIAIGQYGKSEFQYLIRPGGQVTTQRLGYYMDSGMRIPLDRVTLTNKVSPDYVAPPIPTRPYTIFGGVPVSSRSGISERSIPYGASAALRSSGPASSQEPSIHSSTPFSSRISVSRSSVSRTSRSSVSKSESSGSPSDSGMSKSRLVTSPSVFTRASSSVRSPSATTRSEISTASTPFKSSRTGASRSSRSITDSSMTSITERTTTTPPPFILPPDAGGSGSRSFAPPGSYRWSTLNPVADWDYLSKGMQSIPFGRKGHKRKRTIFG